MDKNENFTENKSSSLLTDLNDNYFNTIKHEYLYNKFVVYFQAINASLGSFIIGYNIGVFDTVQINIAQLLHWNDSENKFFTSLITSVVAIGAIFGSLVSGFFMKKYGRRKSLMIFDIIILIGITFTIILNEYLIIAGRLICGFCIGGYLSNVPVYVIEFSPYCVTGLCGTIYELNFCVGLMFSYLFALGLPEKQDQNNQWWRVMLAFPYIIITFNLLIFMFYSRYETPKYLYLFKKDYEETRKCLSFVYKSQAEVEFMMADLEQLSKVQGRNVTIKDLFSKRYRKRFIFILILLTSQQLCGIDAFLMYSEFIFLNNIESKKTATILTNLIGVSQLISAIFAIFIIEKLGRRILLIYGQLLLVINLICISVLYYLQIYTPVVYLFLLFIFINGISLQPISSIYSADILPEIGVGIGMLINNFWNFVIGETFIYMCRSFLKIEGTISIYALCTFLSLIVTIIMAKETKNLSPKQIETLFTSDDEYKIKPSKITDL